MKSKLNMIQLAEDIKTMEYWHPLFKTLKAELSKLGYWRNKSRGNPKKGWEEYQKKKVEG